MLVGSGNLQRGIPLEWLGTVIPELDPVTGLLDPSVLPPLAISQVFVVADQAARLALTAEVGDVAKQTDNGKAYMLKVAPASVNVNWILFSDYLDTFLDLLDTPSSYTGNAGQAFVVNAAENALKTGTQLDILSASGANGSAGASGLQNDPLDTMTNAITKAGSATYIHIEIDDTVVSETVTIPAGKTVYLTGRGGLWTFNGLHTLIMENGSTVILDNVWATLIKEAAGITGAAVFLEESGADDITNNLGGDPTKLDIYSWGAWVDTGVISRISNAASNQGYIIDYNTGRLHNFQDMSIETGKDLFFDGEQASPSRYIRHNGTLFRIGGSTIFEGDSDTGVTIQKEITTALQNYLTLQESDGLGGYVKVLEIDQSGSIDLQGTARIRASADPILAQDLVTKSFMETAISTVPVLKADVTLAGAAPIYADLTGAGWVNGDRGMGIGTGGRIFLMSRYSDALKYVELS